MNKINKITLFIFVSLNLSIIITILLLLHNAVTNGDNNLLYYLSKFNIFKSAKGYEYYICTLLFWGGVGIFSLKLIENIIDGLILSVNESNVKFIILRISLCILYLISIICLSIMLLIFPYYRKITDGLSNFLFLSFWIIQWVLSIIYKIIINRVKN